MDKEVEEEIVERKVNLSPLDAEAFKWQQIRHFVDTFEDMQQLRKGEMSRARMLLYRRLKGLGYDVESKKTDDEKAFGSVISDELIEKAIEKAKADGNLGEQEIEIIDENTKYGKQFKALEGQIIKRIEGPVLQHRIWTEYLSKIKGIGPLTAARLICYMGDCSKFDTISKLWSYAGYRVMEDGTVQRRKKGQKANWNRRLKTLGFLMSDVFVKHRTKYRTLIYDPAKTSLRLAHPEKIKVDGKTKYNDGHIHAMARRKMIKVFLANYWLAVRKIYGLPTRSPWVLEHTKHTTLMEPEKFFES